MKVFITHGVRSGADNLQVFENQLMANLPQPQYAAHRFHYDWWQRNEDSATELAKYVVRKHAGQPVVLIGHSQGGLVCRIAAIMLKGVYNNPGPPFPKHHPTKKIIEKIKAQVSKFECENVSVKGVCTLATPNSGALTMGQMGASARVLSWTIKNALGATGYPNFEQLSTDHLFRAFQCFVVKGTEYRTISGSRFNRFSSLTSDVNLGSALFSGSIPAAIAGISLSLEKPNDGIVEDVSVDLCDGPLPNEVAKQKKIRHFKKYHESTKVTHSSIHQNTHIASKIGSWIQKL